MLSFNMQMPPLSPKSKYDVTKSNYREHLRDQVNKIKKLFNYYNIDVPFFIAGGSIFNIINHVNYSNTDIDVFFYDESHFIEVQNKMSNDTDAFYKTKNAWSITSLPHDIFDSKTPTNELISDEKTSSLRYMMERPIQLIIKRFLPPEEMMQSFDLSCSKCCFTSDYKLIISKDYSNNISFSKYDADTLRRFDKYIEKGAIDNDDSRIKLYRHYIKNIFDEYSDEYNSGKLNGIHILRRYLFNMHDVKYNNLIHDLICEHHDAETRLSIFEELWSAFNSISTKQCLEFSLFWILYDEKIILKSDRMLHKLANITKLTDDDIFQVKMTYPEKFI